MSDSDNQADQADQAEWKALGRRESAAYRRVLALDSALAGAIRRGEKIPDSLPDELAEARKALIAIQSEMDCFGPGFTRPQS